MWCFCNYSKSNRCRLHVWCDLWRSISYLSFYVFKNHFPGENFSWKHGELSTTPWRIGTRTTAKTEESVKSLVLWMFSRPGEDRRSFTCASDGCSSWENHGIVVLRGQENKEINHQPCNFSGAFTGLSKFANLTCNHFR